MKHQKGDIIHGDRSSCYDRTDPFKIFYLDKRRYLSAVIQNFVWGNNDSKEMFKSQITKF